MRPFFLLSLVIALYSCKSATKTKSVKLELIPAEISSAVLKRQAGDIAAGFQLNNQDITEFCKEWNAAKYAGVYKFITQYHLELQTKEGTLIRFRTRDNLIKQEGDRTYKLANEGFIEALFIKKEKEVMQKIHALFVAYTADQESTEEEANKITMLNSFSQLGSLQDSSHLQTLLDVWMYYDPTDFPTRTKVLEVFQRNSSRMKSAIEQRQKNKKVWEAADKAPFSELATLKAQF